MNKGMLLKKESDTGVSVFRVLEVTEKILVIDCVKKTMPVWCDMEQFADYEKVQESVLDGLSVLDEMDGESRKIAYQRFNIISGILPFIANEDMRIQVIKKVAENSGVSVQSVRKYLCEYLATMDISSLAPKKKEEKRPLTAMEKVMRKSLNKWFYTSKKRTLKTVYNLMLQNFYCDEEGVLVEGHPSYRQFYYFYQKYNKKETEYIQTDG